MPLLEIGSAAGEISSASEIRHAQAAREDLDFQHGATVPRTACRTVPLPHTLPSQEMREGQGQGQGQGVRAAQRAVRL